MIQHNMIYYYILCIPDVNVNCYLYIPHCGPLVWPSAQYAKHGKRTSLVFAKERLLTEHFNGGIFHLGVPVEHPKAPKLVCGDL